MVIAPFESAGILLEVALWLSVASPGKRRHDRERGNRVDYIKVLMMAVKYC